jgi:hypothetical protein
MRPLVRAIFVSGTLVACASDVPDEAEDSVSDEIRNGHLDTVHRNVVRVNSCSATLIAPRTVLSAAHCFYQPQGRVNVVVAPNILPIAATYQVHASAAPPDHDVAVLTLDAAATGIEPALLLRTAPLVGEAVTFVGYGRSQLAWPDGKRRAGSSTISDVDGAHFATYGASPTRASIDFGDSGGPAFVVRGGRERLAGIASRARNDCALGNTDCTVSEHARADAELTWIKSRMVEPLYDGSGYDTTPMPKVLTRIEIAGAYSLVAGQPTTLTISAWAPAPSGRFILRVDGVVVHQHVVTSEEVRYSPRVTVNAGTHTLAVHVYDAGDRYLGGRTLTVTAYAP